MSKKLSVSNRYLRDPVLREKLLWISVKSSSAIEGIHQPFSKDAPLTLSRPNANGRAVAKSSKRRRGK